MIRILALAIAAGFLSSCAASQQQVATVSSDVLKVADVACILANSFLDVPSIEQACGIIESQGPAIVQILAAHQAAEAKEAARAHDAGPGK